MENILGILIPLLIAGGSIKDILRAVGGSDIGAAGQDGLRRIISQQNFNMYGLRAGQTQSNINNAIENAVDKLGINPYTGLGQGISSFLGGLYHFAPDTFGSILGIPNGNRFFSMMANGASGISQFSGAGTPDLMNPYSMLAAQKRTMDLSKRFYDLGMRKGGGYNVEFSHGLNVDEMGIVAQRLLTSNIPYKDDKGQSYDLSNKGDSDKFNENLKKLGSKFNDAASSLAKITGSVKEAISYMDRIGGGNFLGGTEEQASKIAKDAKNFAAQIRITSAIAGVSPTEAYKNMQDLTGSMVAGMGLDRTAARASGFDRTFNGMSQYAVGAYLNALATNPGATEAEKQMMMFAAIGRTTEYANSSGSKMVASFANHANLFSDEEKKMVEAALRSGRPNDVLPMIRKRIGGSLFNHEMTDPAAQIAVRERAFKNSRDLYDRLNTAAIQGNYKESADEGARLNYKKTIGDIKYEMEKLTGSDDFSKSIDDGRREKLKSIAKANGFIVSDDMSASEIMSKLENIKGIDRESLEKDVRNAGIDGAKNKMRSLIMSDSDYKIAKRNLINDIRRDKSITGEMKEKLVERLNSGESIDEIYSEYASRTSSDELGSLKNKIYGGKITQETYDSYEKKLNALSEENRTTFTPKEILADIEIDRKQKKLVSQGKVPGILNDVDLSGESKLALEKFRAGVSSMYNKGDLKLESGNEDLSKTYLSAARSIVDSVIGNTLGDLGGEGLDNIKDDIARKMLSGMKEGKKIEDALKESIGNEYEGIGEGGKVRLKDIKDNLGSRESDIVKNSVNLKSFFAYAASELNRNASSVDEKEFEEFKDLAQVKGGKLKGKDLSRFKELLKKFVPESAKEIDARKGNDVKELLTLAHPRGLRDTSYLAEFGASGAKSANIAAASWIADVMGLMRNINNPVISDAWVNHLGLLDDETANNQNRISNAWNVGGPGFYKQAIDQANQDIKGLRGALKETGLEDLERAFAQGGDISPIKEKLIQSGRMNVDRDIAFLKSLSQRSFENTRGLKIVTDEAAWRRAIESKGFDSTMIDVIKETNRNDSTSFDLLGGLGGLAENIAKVFRGGAPIPVKFEQRDVQVIQAK